MAAVVRALEPHLSPQQLAQLLKDTAQPQLASPSHDPGCDQNEVPAPAIDAYQALLSLDTTQAPLRGDQPVREALLDSAVLQSKPGFTEDDLREFLFTYLSNGMPVNPTSPDYTRWDLNGDGFTGGPSPAQFDLDRTGSTLWGKPKLTTVHAPQSILGLDVEFDERAATDLDVLCYYAYSPLYTGDPTVRDAELGPHCLPKVNLSVNFPSTVIRGAVTPLTVNVTRPDFPAPGQDSPQPGVRIELSATGGSVDLASGTTDAAGSLRANATLASAAQPLTITIVARAGQGGPILVTTTVQASAGVPTGEVDGTLSGTSNCGGLCRATITGSVQLFVGAVLSASGKLVIQMQGQLDYHADITTRDPNHPATCDHTHITATPVEPSDPLDPATLTTITVTFVGTQTEVCNDVLQPPTPFTGMLPFQVGEVFRGGSLIALDFTATNHFGEDALVATSGIVPVS